MTDHPETPARRHASLRRPHHLHAVPPSASLSPLRRAIESDEYYAGTAQALVQICGSVDTLETLTTEPHPGERFDPSTAPVADRERVVEIARGVESFAARHLDDELHTIVSRVLAAAATHESRPLVSRSRPERMAAAVVWIALKGNLEIGRRGRWSAGDLWETLGVTSCNDLALGIARQIGALRSPDLHHWDRWPMDPIALGDIRLLSSRTRKWLIARRDEALALIRSIEADRDARRLLIRRQDGRIELRGREVKVLRAVRGTAVTGRDTVMLLFGDDPYDPADVIAVSVPDAHDLMDELDRALAAPWLDPASS